MSALKCIRDLKKIKDDQNNLTKEQIDYRNSIEEMKIYYAKKKH
jgi:hypothetical protein